MLADSEIEAFNEGGVDLPAAGRQHVLDPLERAEDHAVLHLYQTAPPYGLDHLGIEEPGQGLSTICQPQFRKFFPPSARPAHDEAGSHHSTNDHAAWQ